MKIKAVKKPVVIEAVQWTGNNFEEIKEFCGKFKAYNAEIGIPSDDVAFLEEMTFNGVYPSWYTPDLTIRTLEGNHKANVGDYIIKGIHGECYPIKSSIFKETYNIV